MDERVFSEMKERLEKVKDKLHELRGYL